MINKVHRTILSLICISFLLIGFTTVIDSYGDSKTTVKVGYIPEYNNIIEDMYSYSQKGYGYDIFEKIAEISDYEFQYIPIDENYRDSLDNGAIDIVGLYLIPTEEEKIANNDDLVYSNMPLGRVYLYLASSDSAICYDDPQAFNGKTVVTYPNNIGNDVLLEYCQEHDISVNFVYGSIFDYTEIPGDFYMMYSLHDDAEGMYNALNIGVYSIGLATIPENTQLLASIDDELGQILREEADFLWEIGGNYIEDDIQFIHRQLRRSEKDLLSSRVLNVGYIANQPPASYKNADNQPAGILVDTLDYFAQIYNVKFNYLPYNFNDPNTIHENFDILLTLSGDNNTLLNQYYDTTEAFYSIPLYAALDRQESAGYESVNAMLDAGKTIGMLHYLFVDYESFLAAFPNCEIVFYDSIEHLTQDYNEGIIDILAFTETTSTYITPTINNETELILPINTELPFKLLISKEISAEYVPIFNVIQDTIDINVFQGIILDNINEYSNNYTLSDFLGDYGIYILFGFIMIIIAFLLYAIYEQDKNKKLILMTQDIDPVTGLYTHNKFRQETKKLLANATPYSYEFISLDIDLFRSINTYFGMEKGSEVIKTIGKTLEAVFSEPECCIMRRTADQFIVFRKVNAGKQIEEIYLSDILPAVRSVLSDKFNLSMSFGTYVISNCLESSNNMIGYADWARQCGKNKHGTTFTLFDDKMRKQYDDRIDITIKMESALIDREFSVYYQPKVDFNTLEICGAEALVRWLPKHGNTIYPDSFIPIFESNGFISSLDKYVLEEVCKFISSNKEILFIPKISVNLSAWTVLEDNIATDLYKIISKYKLSPDEIELEITESAIIGNETKFLDKITHFRNMGFEISLDDFGAGESSLNRLSDVEVDVIKLDKAFFGYKEQNEKSTIIITNLINMAKHLKMKIVAEGIETEEQAVWLRDIGCDIAQGYYFDRPMNEEAFADILFSDKNYYNMLSDF